MTTQENKQIVAGGQTARPFLTRVTAGGASVLRAVAGVPAGVSRTRRGTFLVVVIGTLALLAVIAIAHFAIGQSDRRAASSVVRAAEIDDVPQQFADYVANLVGRDALGVVPEPVNEIMTPGSTDYQQRYIGRREAVDRPFTSWLTDSTQVQSTLVGGQVPNRAYFTPEGIDSDPWLADIAPRWLNWTGQDTANPEQEFRFRRDWGKISNVAPDGRFVSLMNLRNNFGAEPGFGTGMGNRPRMSANLTLQALQDPNNPLSNPVITNRTDFGMTVPGNSPIGAKPALWDSRQVAAFRPMKVRQNVLPSAPGYLDNEWADTDGDGFADARWFELVDSRALASVQSYLQTDGRLRWFFATRIVDLSGLVNVNTATDLTFEPNAAFPVGMTPADVDLKRLLTLQDSYEQWGFGYDALVQPVQSPANFPAPNPGPMDGNNYLGYNQRSAFQMGSGAYGAIRWTIKGHVVPDRYQSPDWRWEGTGVTQDDQRGVLKHKLWREGGRSLQGASVSGNDVLLPSFFPSADMGELLARFHSNDPRETSRLESATGGRIPAGGGGPVAIRPTAFDPLRQNREEEYERERTKTVNGNATPVRMTDTGVVTPQAMAHIAVDLRGQMTTLSATRPIRSVVGNETTSGGTLPLGTQLLAERDGKLQLGTAAISNNGLSGQESADLFRAYVRSFAPAIKLPEVWPVGSPFDDGGNPFQQRKTLFYGHQGPELGLLMAGAMTTNFELMVRDTNNEVRLSPRTLVFDGRLAEELFDNPSGSPDNANGIPAAPWLYTDRTMSLEVEGAGTARVLADNRNNNVIQTPLLHLYGMGAQPFMTEVGCYTVWRDTPADNGGDNDVDPSIPPVRTVTIDGDMTDENEDYLFRCVAIQLHNPFSEDVLVSTAFPRIGAPANTARVFSYVRVTNFDQNETTPMSTIGLFSVNLADDIGSSTIGGLTLNPGETVVVYVFNRSPADLVTHLINVGVVSDQAEGRRFIERWGESQFRRNDVNRAILGLTMSDDVSSFTSNTSRLVDDPTATKGLTFQMFQTMRANMQDYGGQDELTDADAPNIVGNDRLLDRFRIPVGQSIDARIEAGQQNVSGALAGPEDGVAVPFGEFNRNSGITVARWATASRPKDPANALPRGGLPAYCIEPQRPRDLWHSYFNEDSGDTVQTSQDVTDSLLQRYSEQNDTEGSYDWDSWRDGAFDHAFSETMSRAPIQKTQPDVIQTNRATRPFAEIRDLMPKAARGDKGFGTTDNVFASTLPGDSTATPTLRAADLLLPMPVSPWESPLRPDLQPQTDPRIRYLSTAEAFAVAYGYEQIPAPGTGDNANPLSLYSAAPDGRNSDPLQTYGDLTRPVVLNGHVVIDDFVPFYDGNRDGVFNRTTAYNGYFQSAGTTSGRDIRFGLGIPAALGILDQVVTMGPVYGSVVQPIAGQININTAPANVLRSLPMLTPADETWNVNTDRVVWNNANTWTQMDTAVDLVASITGYRDKVRTFELPGRADPAIFYEDGTFGTPNTFVNSQANPARVVSTEQQIGRAVRTQLNGIREEPGFLSVGELQCVLNRDADDRGQGSTRREKRNIDALGFNNPNRTGTDDNDRPGVNSQMFRFLPPLATTFGVDEVRNDFSERLQVLNAISNLTTVRSDMYACWFIVRGYAQSDVENLGPDDQMAPSVERRFLMILDRSNVVEARQTKPRIVMIKEVPM